MYAGQQPLTGLVDDIDRIDFERWKSFNPQSSKPVLRDIPTCTTEINSIIQDPGKIAPNRRIASSTERETIVKIMMRTAIFHQRDEKYLLARFDFKKYDAAIAVNYFILYEIEHLARDLLDQSTVGFTDIDALCGYEKLYKYSGTDKETYHQWFQEVLAENLIGLSHRMQERVDQIDSTVQNLRLTAAPNNLRFGDVKTIRGIDFDYAKFVSVSTYHGLNLIGTVIQLPDRNGRERQIVFQNPSFSQNHTKGNDGWSPYTLRAHYAFADNTSDYYEWVNARIVRGKIDMMIKLFMRSVYSLVLTSMCMINIFHPIMHIYQTCLSALCKNMKFSHLYHELMVTEENTLIPSICLLTLTIVCSFIDWQKARKDSAFFYKN